MARLEVTNSEWNALNKVVAMAEVKATLHSKNEFDKQQSEAAIRVARSILVDAIIEDEEYGIEEAEEERHNYKRGD